MVADISWNEMRGPDGAVRPHWQVLDRALNDFGPGEMWRRWEQARQLIRQHGVSFNVYGDARGLDRPWPLDPVPVVLAPDEFSALAAGLAQRATLLDRLLADLYGPRRVIAEGLLPPEVVLAHPGLLRACAGICATRRRSNPRRARRWPRANETSTKTARNSSACRPGPRASRAACAGSCRARA